MKFGLSTQD